MSRAELPTEPDYESYALDLRSQLFPGLSVDVAMPLERLTSPHLMRTVSAMLSVRVTTHRMMPRNVWGVTTIRGESATIWLNREAWPELQLRVGRSFFTVSHELSHCYLDHGSALAGLERRADRPLEDRLELAANRLATHLLIPSAAMRTINRATPAGIAVRFCVSERMAAKRIAELAMHAAETT